ncbi:MAG: PorP/SprF family type IX secretion system membrane protein [Flavobacteriales bacterium]
MKSYSPIWILILAFYSFSTKAQDIHFSQFYNSPLTLNPAQTGVFNGDYRFAGNYRNQWNSVTIPFSTFSMSGDMKNALGVKNLGLGIVFNHDNTGDSRFRTTVFNVSGSYGFDLDENSKQQLTVGIQTGFTNKNLSYDELKFDAQYNGLAFNGGLPNRENFNTNTQNFFNLHSGVNYTNTIGNREVFQAGIGVFNLTKPKESYFNNQAIEVDRRISIYANYQVQITNEIDILPATFFMKQGKYFEYIIGARGKYILSEAAGAVQSAYLGLFFRTKDAGFITAEYDYNNWHFGLSYDINLSTLRQASNGRGGIELSAIYILRKIKPSSNKYKRCPDYI